METDLDESNVDSKAAGAAGSVMSGESKAADVLEALGGFLTDKSVGKRKLGLAFVSGFLAGLGPDFLDAAESALFARFFRDRMNDHHSMVPEIIRGVASVFPWANLQAEDLRSLVEAFFASVHTQSQVVGDRRAVFEAVAGLLFSPPKLDQLRPMGSNFVLGFIQSVDSEKDPVSMRLIFAMWPVVLDNFELEPFEEDVFESLSCYFPVDFSPPPGGATGGGVTREQLALGLRGCLSRSAAFAPLVMPLLLDKLDSDSADAKAESLATLAECAKAYSPGQLSPHLEQLWKLLHRETMGIRTRRPADEAVVAACFRAVAAVTESLSAAVQTPDNRRALDGWIDAVWSDTGRHLHDVELKFMSTSVDVLSCVTGCGGRLASAAMLDRAMPVLLRLFDANEAARMPAMAAAAKLLRGSKPSGGQLPAWHAAFTYACGLAVGSGAAPLQVAACSAVVSGAAWLQPSDAAALFDCLLGKALAGCLPLSEAVVADAVEATVSRSGEERPSGEDVRRLVEDFGRCDCRFLAAVLRDKKLLGQHLHDTITGNDVSDGVFGLVEAVLSHHPFGQLEAGVATGLSRWVVASEPEQVRGCEGFRRILPLVAKHQVGHPDEYKLVLDDIIERRRVADLAAPFVCYAPASLLDDNVDALSALVASGLPWDDPSTCLMLAAIANKVSEPFFASPDDCRSSLELCWITKGLVYRRLPYPDAGRWIGSLLEAFIGQPTSELAAAMADLSGKLDDCLDCPPARAALARQKFFNLTKPGLVEAFGANRDNADKAAHYLRALVAQLPGVPGFVLSSELPQLLPMLSGGLRSGSADLTLSALSSLLDLLGQEAESFGPHVAVFLPTWLELSCSRGQAIGVRVKALQCVRATAKAGLSDVVQHKKLAIRGLAPALDDHKRIVRMEAALAKNQWHLC